MAHSMGGAVAMALALRAPERVSRLALFGPVGFGVVDRAAWSQLLPPSLTGALLPRRIPRWAVKFALRHSRGEAGISDEQEVDEYWAPTQFPSFLNAMRLLLHGFSWAPWTPTELAPVQQPVLLVFGDRDPVVRPQSVVPTLARCLRGAELQVAQGAGHVVPEERPAWALERLLPFLGAPALATVSTAEAAG
ncbi:MAG: alpha/beta hydrolase [Gemmatimonadaceae bacterium]|nr:alpha/beta hydrolase [Gemmatimonadaceae bacterium]